MSYPRVFLFDSSNPSPILPYVDDQLMVAAMRNAIRTDEEHPWTESPEHFTMSILVQTPSMPLPQEVLRTDEESCAMGLVLGRFYCTEEHPHGKLVAIALPLSFPEADIP
ncbi:hypothetical protein FALBO_5093 [Fusarium albosuccineum]|uniref:Uncharacterized protein n=1 Tax=Fusarium albosuccineum TaxID=1237068 RepID=A0A8H4LE71_9HYPO|nr:hypothetical protein FALBO_5093 [Fusarium albosuccineum]